MYFSETSLTKQSPNNIKEKNAYMFQETGSYFTEMWVIIVVLLFQISHKTHLKPVDFFNIPKYYLQLVITEHVPSLPALLQVTLQTKENMSLRLSLAWPS